MEKTITLKLSTIEEIIGSNEMLIKKAKNNLAKKESFNDLDKAIELNMHKLEGENNILRLLRDTCK